MGKGTTLTTTARARGSRALPLLIGIGRASAATVTIEATGALTGPTGTTGGPLESGALEYRSTAHAFE